jgi:hypothetical protein
LYLKSVNICFFKHELLWKVLLADKSEGGWTTVDEYLSDEVASDSEDEKRIRVAENRAVKKNKTSKKEDTQRGKNDQRKQPERLHKLHIMAEVLFHICFSDFIFIKSVNIITTLYLRSVSICFFKHELLWKILVC